jgi:hypothetical protein
MWVAVMHASPVGPRTRSTSSSPLCVPCAGLAHDLGHGPFSHVFEGMFLPALEKRGKAQLGWSHEEMSAELVELVFTEAGLDWDTEGVQRVKDLISFGKLEPKHSWEDRRFLTQARGTLGSCCHPACPAGLRRKGLGHVLLRCLVLVDDHQGQGDACCLGSRPGVILRWVASAVLVNATCCRSRRQ